MRNCEKMRVLAFSFLFLIPSLLAQSIHYPIITLWNGTGIIQPDGPPSVTLTNVGGELKITVSAPFFNSPSIIELPFWGGKDPLLGDTCRQRTFYELWNYEVVEVFLLNDRKDYLEIEFSPRGRYLVLLLSGYRNDLLHSLPLDVDIQNECPNDSNETPCTDTWTASATVPRQYLPFNVSGINAYAIHGRTWGEVTPAAHDLVYLSKFPVEHSEISAPDFHYLDGFGPLSLASIGIKNDEVVSDLWKAATGDKNYKMRYDFDRKSDCTKLPDYYEGHVVSKKDSAMKRLAIQVHINEGENVIPSIPDNLKSADSSGTLTNETESFWVTYSNEARERLRVGVNPYEAHQVELWSKDTMLSDNYNLTDVICTFSSNASIWTCHFSLDWALLPPNVSHFQMIHAHMNLESSDESDDPNPMEGREFFGAVCPGLPSGKKERIDWEGCQIDLRTIVATEANAKYSHIWMEELGKEAERESEDSQDTD